VYSCQSGCAAGETRCGTACVDARTDETHCGACGVACATRPNSTPLCTAGACGMACVGGYADCDLAAVSGCETNTRTDERNCGACGRACPASYTCLDGACAPPRSCLEQQRLVPSSPSGAYTIDPDGPGGNAPFVASCDMATDGGGWTEVFLYAGANLNTTLVDYTTRDRALMTGATRVLVSYRTGARTTVGVFGSFTMPANWRARSPFMYPAVDETVSVRLSTGTTLSTTLKYGYRTFSRLCADPWVTSSNYGRLCFAGTTMPFFNAFAATAADFCPDSTERYDAATCSASRRFAIHVR
jgi:hypothetical protein